MFAKWKKVMKLILNEKEFRKGGKNKRNLMSEKLKSIPEHLKEKIIREYMYKCKNSFVDQIRHGKAPSKLDYDISEELGYILPSALVRRI